MSLPDHRKDSFVDSQFVSKGADQIGMTREELIAEIRKQLQEELRGYTNSVVSEENQKKISEVKDEAAEFVKENPWMSVAIASLAGFLIARMLYKRGDE